MFPAAQRALRMAAKRASAESGEAAFGAPVANSVLAALPRADYQRLLPSLEPVTLKFGEVLHEPGAPIRYVYFPVDCVICLLTRTEGQRAIETGLVGYEGVVGIALALGVTVSPIRTLVQAGGTALRMGAACFDSELQRCPQLQRELWRYAYVKMAQATCCMNVHLGLMPTIGCRTVGRCAAAPTGEGDGAQTASDRMVVDRWRPPSAVIATNGNTAMVVIQRGIRPSSACSTASDRLMGRSASRVTPTELATMSVVR